MNFDNGYTRTILGALIVVAYGFLAFPFIANLDFNGSIIIALIGMFAAVWFATKIIFDN